MKQKFNVTGMTCSACSAHVEKAVGKLEGVEGVSVNLLGNNMLVDDLNRRLADKQLTVRLTGETKRFVIDSSYDPAFGARPLRRYVQHTVETLISRRIIAGEVEPGATLTVDVRDGALTVEARTVLTGEVVEG